MKKLLLLAVLALGAVACEKNDLGDMNESSINAPIEAVVVDTSKFTSILDRLTSTKFEKKNNETGKSNPIGSYLRIIDGIVDGAIYEFAYSDDNDTDLCNITAGLEGLYYVLINDQGHVAISETSDGADPYVVIEYDYAYVFTGSFLQGVKIENGSFTVASKNTEGTVFTFN